jgi:hypothetical protein
LHGLIDTICDPVTGWLQYILDSISNMQLPLNHPLDISHYLGVFALLGPAWVSFIINACLMAFIYVVCFIVVSHQGLFVKFKDTIKWW